MTHRSRLAVPPVPDPLPLPGPPSADVAVSITASPALDAPDALAAADELGATPALPTDAPREPAAELPPAVDHLSLAVYTAPYAICGFGFMLVNAYLLKYATDTLGVPVAAMGWIFFTSRIWDAVSDPIVGYLSDRTRTRFGRRRPWILASVVPLAITLVMLWSPPAGLAGPGLVAWVGASFILFYTAITAFNVPHESLGAELSLDYVERTRVFGWRRVGFGVGALGAMSAMFLLTGFDLATEAGRSDARGMAFTVALVAGVLAVGVTAFSVGRMRERRDFGARALASPLRAIADVLHNPHARLLIVVFFLQQIGVMSLVTSLPFFADYVLGDEQLAPVMMGVLFGGSLISIPFWVTLSRRFDKKRALLVSMVGISVVMAILLTVESGDRFLIIAATAIAAVAAGALDTLLPSTQADVVDYDELLTGDRKEGTYFAAWNFGQKSAAGLAALAVSSLLATVGYDPKLVPDEGVLTAIRWSFAGIPLICFSLGTLVFARFSLDREAHAEIRARIDARAASARAAGSRAGEPVL